KYVKIAGITIREVNFQKLFRKFYLSIRNNRRNLPTKRNSCEINGFDYCRKTVSSDSKKY
ncbi:MAG: hypothetical protein ACXAC6_13380, partial [Candidatus Hodarchaeales archaeon]